MGWQALSAGEGAKGHRLYDWARVPLNYTAGEGFSRWFLARRSLRDPEAIACFFAYARSDATLMELAAAAELCWTIEECFLRAKDDLGLDHCEARSWHGWHRHMGLVMAAAAFLAPKMGWLPPSPDGITMCQNVGNFNATEAERTAK